MWFPVPWTKTVCAEGTQTQDTHSFPSCLRHCSYYSCRDVTKEEGEREKKDKVSLFDALPPRSSGSPCIFNPGAAQPSWFC